MKSFFNPLAAMTEIGSFTYSGCRYAGIKPGLYFAVLSDGLAQYLKETFPVLVEVEAEAETVSSIYCCDKCGKDCKSTYMKERHEKSCKAEGKKKPVLLRPEYIFWHYRELDQTQIPEDMKIPMYATPPSMATNTDLPSNNKDFVDMPELQSGRKGTALIGKSMQPVVTDRDGIEWYGEGVTDDIA